ncbi:hypothetical protein D3C84_1307820 [compost metagenome]
MKTDDDDIGALGQFFTRGSKGSGGDQRHIAIGHQHIVKTFGNRLTRGKHRMPGPEPLCL